MIFPWFFPFLRRCPAVLCAVLVGMWCLYPGSAFAVVSREDKAVMIPELPSQQPRLQYQYLDLAVSRQDLLFANFSRPGRAAEIYDRKGAYRAQVFTYRGADSRGFAAVANPGTPSELNYGGTLAVGVGEPLEIQMGYIGGRLQWSEEDYLFNPPTEQEANSWNLGAQTQWLDNSLRTRIEYASSEQRLENQNNAMENTLGRAMTAEVSVSSDGVFSSGWLDRWQGTALYRAVDRNFYSLGNLEPVRGEDMAQLQFQSEFRGLGVALEWKQEGHCDAVGMTRFDPTLNRSGLQLNYQWQNPFPLPLGRPMLSARYYHVSQWQTHDVVALQGYEMLQEADEAGVNLKFDYEQWRWSVDYLISEQDHRRLSLDASVQDWEQPSDQVHETAELLLGWSPTKRFWMNLNARWNDQVETEFANRQQYRNYGMQAFIGDLPRNLSMQMEYYYGDHALSQGLGDDLATQFRSHSGNARITWQAVPERGRQPALDIYLHSSFNRQFDLANDIELSHWSAAVGIELFWGQY